MQIIYIYVIYSYLEASIIKRDNILNKKSFINIITKPRKFGGILNK